MPCHLYRCDLPLLRPLATSRGLISQRTTWVVEIVTDSGACGYGEAAPLPGFGGEDPELCAKALDKAVNALTSEAVSRWLERGKADAPLGHLLEPLLTHTPCARHAIEGALIDLLAQSRGYPVSAFLAETCLSGSSSVVVQVNALVDGPEEARWAAGQGYRTVKAKISGEPWHAAERALAIRAALDSFSSVATPGAALKLRLDANGAWNLDQALDFCARSTAAGLELLEQPLDPLRTSHLDELSTLRRRAGCRISVDESIRSAADVGRVGAAQAADAVVLKPMFLGGWRPTLQAVQLARTCGLGVIVTSALDGSIGLAFAAHMAAACSLTEFAHGLATGERFEADLTTEPLTVKNGGMLIRDRPGLGIGTLAG